MLAAAGIHVSLRKVERPYAIRPAQVIGVELILLTALALSHQWLGADLIAAYEGKGGGLVGWALSEPPIDFLGPILTGLLYLTLFLWGIALLLGLRWHDVHHLLSEVSGELGRWAAKVAPPNGRRHLRLPPLLRLCRPRRRVPPLPKHQQSRLPLEMSGARAVCPRPTFWRPVRPSVSMKLK